MVAASQGLQLEVPADPAEDLGAVPSTHTRGLTATLNSSSRRCNTLWPQPQAPAHTCAHVLTEIHRHIGEIKS